MFIYKITVNNLVYIGLDTKPIYKKSRWKNHTKAAHNTTSNSKLHRAMRNTGEDQWHYEVVQSGFPDLGSLAIAEIEYIAKFDSFVNGLNSSPGGDGLGHHNLSRLSAEDIETIKEKLGVHFKNYNKIKWANTSIEERRRLTKHLHTDEVYQKKSKTLKEFYKEFPNARREKGKNIKKWQESNPEQLKAQNRKNGLKGAMASAKKLKVVDTAGNTVIYISKAEFHRKTGQWPKTIIEKTKNGEFYNGFKAWEVKQ